MSIKLRYFFMGLSLGLLIGLAVTIDLSTRLDSMVKENQELLQKLK